MRIWSKPDEELLEYIASKRSLFSEEVQHKLDEVVGLVIKENNLDIYGSGVENISIQFILSFVVQKLTEENGEGRGIFVQVADKKYKTRVSAIKAGMGPLAGYLNQNAEGIWNCIDTDTKKTIMALIRGGFHGSFFISKRRSPLEEIGRLALQTACNEAYMEILNNHQYLLDYATS